MAKLKKPARPVRINRIAKKVAEHAEKMRALLGGRNKPFKRHERRPRVKRMIAYDLETSRIQKGTPRPLYITAFGEKFCLSMGVKSLPHLAEIVTARLLDPDLSGVRYVGWNANNFDSYFIGAALLHCPEYTLRPYLTRGKTLRGLKVTSRENTKLSWEFLDGMSMTGLLCALKSKPGESAKSFFATFAPEFDQQGIIDFEKEEFDALNIEHVRYAERDSEGLYVGLMRVRDILREHFNIDLAPTIGNTGIRIFQANMPENLNVWAPALPVVEALRKYAMRGGFVCVNRKFKGPVWKYDLNQAYAAAMREAWLPCGRCVHTDHINRFAPTGIYRLSAAHRTNRVPFYYRNITEDSIQAKNEITDTWLTSIEIDQLKVEGWKIEITEGYFWDEVFNMRAYVDKLETLRASDPLGPNGALGTMVKYIGNNSYGKTVEQLDGIELVLSKDCPDGFNDYQAETDLLQHVWFRFCDPIPREYHQPQLGAFITAHVRMVVRRAALLDPESWLYADTDCVVFDRPIDLNCHPKKYGFWKLEADGVPYRIIAPKVYSTVGGSVMHAKGLNIKKLTDADFEKWYNGVSPRQKQVQRNNWVKVMTGADMYLEREKVGQKTFL